MIIKSLPESCRGWVSPAIQSAEEAGQAGGAEVADVAVPQAGQAGCCQRQRDPTVSVRLAAKNWTESVGPGEIPAGRLLGPEVS